MNGYIKYYYIILFLQIFMKLFLYEIIDSLFKLFYFVHLFVTEYTYNLAQLSIFYHTKT